MNENKPIISIRIKSLRKEYGYTQEQLANALGLNAKSSIANYENGANSPSDEIKKKMTELFNCTLDYLIGLSDIREVNCSYMEPNSQIQEQYYMCPVYPSNTILDYNWAKECIEGRIPINCILFHITFPEEYFFLHMTDDSMNKVVKHNSYALVHKQSKIENGEIVALLKNNTEIILRKWNQQKDFLLLEPLSDNHRFQIQVYDKTTTLQILGKYIGKFELNTDMSLLS